MSNELTVRNDAVVVANEASQLPTLQPAVLEWARKKLDETRAEYADLDQAATEAKRKKWNPHAIRRAATKALARVTFYEKVVAALEAGYMLFPPVPNADCIAVRVTEDTFQFVDRCRDLSQWHRPVGECAADVLPGGEGKYINPVVRWTLLRKYEKETNNTGGKETRMEWMSLDLEDPAFPVAMAKPEIVEATSAAMGLKVFDEIRMFPFERRRKGDPCILGSIALRTGKNVDRRLYFLISWRINATDI